MKALEIKKILKNKGLEVKGLSVRHEYAGYEEVYWVNGNSKKHNLEAIKNILEKLLESINYDERTGEFLAGGNTLVFVQDENHMSI